jgi:adenylyltransferase/sulfurtransferase
MIGKFFRKLAGMNSELEISARETKRQLDSENPPRLIDVRGPDEFAHCRIDGAELIPLNLLAEKFNAAFPDPGQPVILYCHHGMRSMRAAQFLASKGCINARSMAGGIEAWSVEIDPSVPRY